MPEMSRANDGCRSQFEGQVINNYHCEAPQNTAVECAQIHVSEHKFPKKKRVKKKSSGFSPWIWWTAYVGRLKDTCQRR